MAQQGGLAQRAPTVVSMATPPNTHGVMKGSGGTRILVDSGGHLINAQGQRVDAWGRPTRPRGAPGKESRRKREEKWRAQQDWAWPRREDFREEERPRPSQSPHVWTQGDYCDEAWGPSPTIDYNKKNSGGSSSDIAFTPVELGPQPPPGPPPQHRLDETPEAAAKKKHWYMCTRMPDGYVPPGPPPGPPSSPPPEETPTPPARDEGIWASRGYSVQEWKEFFQRTDRQTAEHYARTKQ